MSRLSEYDYLLPPELIAQEPLKERTASRLLCLNKHTGEIEDRTFTDLATLLSPGDLLVLNNTRVTALRLFGAKSTGGRVETLLLEEVAPHRYVCLAKPAKRLTVGTEIRFDGGLIASVVELLEEGKRLLQFEPTESFRQNLAQSGEVPLPPYIDHVLEDPERYQTVVASEAGSAAAPTAALHFSSEFLERLSKTGIDIAFVTLSVGLDTFRPVQVEDLDDHRMHGERCSVPPETAEKIAACPGRIIAVGTTAVRTLESFAQGPRAVSPGSVTTRLFIQPGYRFQVIDGMLTNFHLPKTTMLVMIAALCGREHVLNAYRHAVAEKYRFLSFGDSMFIS